MIVCVCVYFIHSLLYKLFFETEIWLAVKTPNAHVCRKHWTLQTKSKKKFKMIQLESIGCLAAFYWLLVGRSFFKIRCKQIYKAFNIYIYILRFSSCFCWTSAKFFLNLWLILVMPLDRQRNRLDIVEWVSLFDFDKIRWFRTQRIRQILRCECLLKVSFFIWRIQRINNWLNV